MLLQNGETFYGVCGGSVAGAWCGGSGGVWYENIVCFSACSRHAMSQSHHEGGGEDTEILEGREWGA